MKSHFSETRRRSNWLEFRDPLGAISMDEEVATWVVTALKESHADEKRNHDESVARLQKQYRTLQKRLDAMYIMANNQRGKKEKTASPRNTAFFDNWLPGRDSNPRPGD